MNPFFFIAWLLLVSGMCEAGIWRDDFEDKNTREWKIFNEDPKVEKWWIDDGEAVGEIFLEGFMSLWIWNHINRKKLSYIGFGGKGYQIRDIIHIDDLCRLIHRQIILFLSIVALLFLVQQLLKNSPEGQFLKSIRAAVAAVAISPSS